MIRLQPISTSDLQHYKFMEELLVDSFPPEEYRQLEQLRERKADAYISKEIKILSDELSAVERQVAKYNKYK